MKALKANVTNAFQKETRIPTCDNSGAKELRIISFYNRNTSKGRVPTGGVGDLIQASVCKGNPEMRKQVVFAVIVRQKKEYRRPNGERVKFEDNAAVVLKDEKGNPKGTMFKGPIAKEAADRWPPISKMASIIL
ncbi:MAG: 50S ribosomal protein L14 [Candidatus Nanoarchaeia archaeon]|nr:50S ribosomal protein L14 [Candidatus Nanoarchaeia archaeon]MDD5587727.1 50S ribosomal protein L14 [Candidatus Nanoarchaeia archaeon]